MFVIKIVPLFAFIVSTGVLAGQESVLTDGQIAVSYEDIERYIVENIPPDPDAKGAILNRAGIYQEMAETLYTVRVLAAEAEKLADFDHEQAKWTAHLLYQRHLVDDYRIKFVKQALKDVNWDAAAKETYEVHKDEYMSKERINASHILIKVEKRSDEEAIALAGQMRRRALEGENFEELAKQYSEDQSAAKNAGNLGFIERGQMVAPFEDAAFRMRKPESISDVVKTPFGYHVIKYHARKMPEQIPFESVKAKIVDKLQTKMGSQVWQDKIIAIRSDSDIVVDEKQLQDLKETYQTKKTPQ